MLGDKIGRRRTFLITITAETIFTVLLSLLYNSTILFSILTSLICLVIGGEFGAAFAAVVELVPSQHRGKTMLLAINFWNLGPVVLSILSILYKSMFETLSTYIRSLLISIMLAAIVIGLIRIKIPESIRWLVINRKFKEAENVLAKYFRVKVTKEDLEIFEKQLVSIEQERLTFRKAVSTYFDRLIILFVITVTVYVTYFVTALYLPYTPDFPFKGLIPYAILVTNAGSFIGAFLLIPNN